MLFIFIPFCFVSFVTSIGMSGARCSAEVRPGLRSTGAMKSMLRRNMREDWKVWGQDAPWWSLLSKKSVDRSGPLNQGMNTSGEAGSCSSSPWECEGMVWGEVVAWSWFRSNLSGTELEKNEEQFGLRWKNNLTAPDIHFPRGPTRQKPRDGNHSNSLYELWRSNIIPRQFPWCKFYITAPKIDCK